MTVQVQLVDGRYRIGGDWDGVEPANAFLGHLRARAFSPATVRAYAFDLVNLARFLTGQGMRLAAVTPVDVFAWVDWQGVRRDGADRPGTVVALRRTAAASTVNRRVAAVRAFFEYLVMTGARTGNPVPSPRRGQGLRPAARGLLGHLGPGRPRGGGRLVRQPRRLPESLSAGDVDMFVASLRTHRDRAMVLAMLLGGLRSAEVRGLKLADVDMGRRRLRVIGKGGKERHVPADQAFFIELAAYLRLERPPGLATAGVRFALGGSVYDWNDPFARMFLQILAVIAEFEANLIRQRTREGMAVARQNGKLRGKQPVLKPAQDREIRRMHDSGDYNIAGIAALFSVSRPTVYRSLQRTTDLSPLPADTRPAPDIARYDQLLTRRPD